MKTIKNKPGRKKGSGLPVMTLSMKISPLTYQAIREYAKPRYWTIRRTVEAAIEKLTQE